MKHLLLLIFLLAPVCLTATDIEFETWTDMKVFMNNFSEDITKQPWGNFQTPKQNGLYVLIGNLDGITYRFAFDGTASETAEFEATYKILCNAQPPKRDGEGRYLMVDQGFNPLFRGQWTSISDYINVATPSLSIRNKGQEAFWCTLKSDNDMIPASATSAVWPSDADDCYSPYQANALKHYVLPDQMPIPAGWKRKRLRFLFMDTINLKQGLIKFTGAKHGKIFIDSYIVERNLFFNHTLPVSESNPVASIVTTYVSHINMEGAGYEDFTEVKASEDLPFYILPYGVMLELWVEVTFDSSAFNTAETRCTGSARTWLYREKTVGK